jgi:hypothetical protein
MLVPLMYSVHAILCFENFVSQMSPTISQTLPREMTSFLVAVMFVAQRGHLDLSA